MNAKFIITATIQEKDVAAAAPISPNSGMKMKFNVVFKDTLKILILNTAFISPILDNAPPIEI